MNPLELVMLVVIGALLLSVWLLIRESDGKASRPYEPMERPSKEEIKRYNERTNEIIETCVNESLKK